MALELALSDERTRGAANRQRLTDLSARLEELEARCLSSGSPQQDDECCMRKALESQQRQLQQIQQHMEVIRQLPQTSSGDAQQDPSEQLREENLQLRRDLRQSREVLAYYEQRTQLAPVMCQGTRRDPAGAGDPPGLDLDQLEASAATDTLSPSFMADENFCFAVDAAGPNQQLDLQAARPLKGHRASADPASTRGASPTVVGSSGCRSPPCRKPARVPPSKPLQPRHHGGGTGNRSQA